MNDQEIPNDDVTDVEDIDDVEPHGLKDVMVGLSTAALVTGGVAAVATTQDATARPRHIQVADSPHLAMADADVQASAAVSAPGTPDEFTGTSDQHLKIQPAISARGTVLYGAGDDVPEDDVSAPTLLGDAMDRADAVVDNLDRTRDLRNAAVDVVRVSMAAAHTSAHTVPVHDTAADTVKKVDAAIVLAEDVVRGIEGAATSTLVRVQPQAGAGLNTHGATGWVSVSAGGEEIARGEVKDGRATVSWQTPHADVPLTLHYSGDALLNTATLAL